MSAQSLANPCGLYLGIQRPFAAIGSEGTATDDCLHFEANHGLTTITGLTQLTSIGGHLSINGNHNLCSFPGLANVRRVMGYMYFANNCRGRAFDWSGLNDLECHGGFLADVHDNCPGCPSRLLNLPRCQ